MITKFQGKNIHYTRSGQGEALILLHGFLESKEIWKELISELSRYNNVIAIDLPGHGDSDVLAEIHTMELLAESVYAVLENLQIRKAHFMGHSMGGYVALAFLDLHPDRIQGITLLNSTPEADSEEKKTNRDRSVELVRKNKKAFISMAVANLLSSDNSARLQVQIEILKQKASQFPTEGITAALLGMKIRTDKIDVLKDYDKSKSIITGENDPLITLNSIKTISDGCNSRFFTLPGGHLSYIESTQELIKLCISSKIFTF